MAYRGGRGRVRPQNEGFMVSDGSDDDDDVTFGTNANLNSGDQGDDMDIGANFDFGQAEDDLEADLFDGLEDIGMGTNKTSSTKKPDRLQQRLRKRKAKTQFKDDDDDDDDTDVQFGGTNKNEEKKGGRIDPVVKQKMDAMRNKIIQYKEHVEVLKTKRKKEHQENKKLRNELTELRDKLSEQEIGGGGSTFASYTVGGAIGNTEKEAEKNRKRQEARRQLFAGVQGDQGDDFLEMGDAASGLRLFIMKITRYVRQHLIPLNADVKKVEARYGGLVSSYYKFSQWLLINALVLGVVYSLFLGYHLVSSQNTAQVPKKYTYTTGTNCTNITAIDSKTTAATVQGTYQACNYTITGQPNSNVMISIFPELLSFSGYLHSEAFLYALCLIGSFLLLLYNTLQKWVAEDRRNKVLVHFGGANKQKYSALVLNAWDHSVRGKVAVEDQMKSIAASLQATLHEEFSAERRQEMTAQERYIALGRRIAGNLIWFALQSGTAYAIISLFANSESIGAWAATIDPSLANFEVVPLIVTVINAAVPTTIKLVTKLVDNLDNQADYVKSVVFRVFFARTLNVMIVVWGNLLLFDPFLGASENLIFGSSWSSLRDASKKTFTPVSMGYCRGNQVANGFVQLLLSEFFVSKAIGVGTGVSMQLVAKVLKKPYEKAEFDTANKMLSLFYFQQLSFLCTVFMPVVSAFLPILGFLTFKFEVWLLENYHTKPKKPFQAKNIALFFIKFYLMSLVMGIVVMHLALGSDRLPKNCLRQLADYKVWKAAATQASTYTDMSLTKECKTTLLTHPVPYGALTDGHSTHFKNQTLTSFQDYTADLTINETKMLWCACRVACGPFIDSTSGYSPITEQIAQSSFLNAIYNTLFIQPVFVWAMVIMAATTVLFKGATVTVLNDLQEETKQTAQMNEKILRSKMRQKDAEIRKLKDLQQ